MNKLIYRGVFAGVVWLIAICCAIGQSSQPPAKTIFAHYMGCYPIGYGAIDHHWRNIDLKHDSSDLLAALGGRVVNWPLLPQGEILSPDESAELEIRRAIRAGIDGFAIDAWAGGEVAKQTLDRLFAAAERMKVPFSLTVCLDPACHPKGPVGNHIATYSETISWLIERHGSSPNLARRDGKVLIFGYGSSSIIYSDEFRALPETPQKWQQVTDAYKQVETNVGQPIYFHFDFDNMGSKDPAVRLNAATWAASNFDAVGGFLGNFWDADENIIAAIKTAGAEWSQPIYFQYNNKAGSLFVEPGTDMLRKAHEKARASDSSLIQFVTWNDYGEDTILAPGYSTGYTILNLNRYLVDWWKSGAEPAVEKDQLHLIFRRAVEGSRVFPFQLRRSEPGGVLEVATILTTPGQVAVPGYGITYDAPAGLHVRQFPLQTGKVEATLSRAGVTILDVRAPEEVTDKPFREDNSMVCFSSTFLDEWRTDFGNTPPLLYSENGDADSDGLPNWFEMYYFGKFPDMATATGADPGANPDNDEFTNKQEYQNQTDPRMAERSYEVGFVWDMTAIQQKGVSFDPDRDAYQNDIWHYLYKHGDSGQIPHDGNYIRMPSISVNVPYAGKMAHLSPAQDPDGITYRYLHGWIAHRQLPDGRWQMVMRPRANAAVILGWKSPVNGTVDVAFGVKEVTGADPITFDVIRNNETTPLHTESVPVGGMSEIALGQVSVKKGDFLYIVADGKPRNDSSAAWLENLQIRLKSTHE